ncbi:hypothetical protein EDD18DRAFT_1114456 [Armillaria luteobubalina]|uniref:Uncharacterized protein n=1 Tax=Armillaria luteobubalina TaxID=153913 RepID=A0AA39P5M5_9AGAR|nr:hypothetical protein EDD18DRAFT_1114456 [Armillaria luteobubalina]
MSGHPNKRHQTAGPIFGAPSEVDNPSAQLNYPSSAASSMRTLPVYAVPGLVALSVQEFSRVHAGIKDSEDLLFISWDRVVRLIPPHLPDIDPSLPTSPTGRQRVATADQRWGDAGGLRAIENTIYYFAQQ